MAGMKEENRLRIRIAWEILLLCGYFYFIPTLMALIVHEDGRRFGHCLLLLMFLCAVPLCLRNGFRYFSRLKQLNSAKS
jgi:hypothetical protein